MKKGIITFAFIFSLSLIGCDDSEEQSMDSPQALAEQLEVLNGEIMQLINISCTLATAQSADKPTESNCKSIAFGAKPCGGPRSYLIYSLSATNEELLIAKVAEYNAIDDERNKLINAISDCMFVLPPVVDCISGTCQEVGN